MYLELEKELAQGNPCVLVTILQSEGSTPRKAGAQLFVSNDARGGTIGGGNLEFTAENIGRDLLKENIISEVKDFNLGTDKTPDTVTDLGMVCGGKTRVLFQRLDPNAQSVAFAQEMAEIMHANMKAWLSINVTDPSKATNEIIMKESEELPKVPKLINKDGESIFYLPLGTDAKVYVFGGGHVSQATVPLLEKLDFKCVVVDDSPEFANSQNFPTATEVLVMPFESVEENIKLTPQDYVIIMTRGHNADYTVERQTLRQNPYYIGMIGSRRKIASVNQRMINDGYTNQDLVKVNAPIGLDIKAQTPMEIAVSIAGELILKRAEFAEK